MGVVVDRSVESAKAGDGVTFPQHGDTCRMHYVGRLMDYRSTIFDSSREKGRPFDFVIGHGVVIQGWDEGVAQLSLGERATLRITSDYGYGERGAGDVIPPNADLVFDVELLAINPKDESAGGCCVLA